MACAYSGFPLQDVRITREEFISMKESGKLPFGQVPLLELSTGDCLSQSAAIMRYIGKQTGLYPKDDDVAACLVDGIIDEEIDLFTGLAVSRYTARFGFNILNEMPELVPPVRAALNDEVLPRHLACLETILSRSRSGWIANTEGPSIADFVLVPRLQWLQSGDNVGISTEILQPFPLLVAMMLKLMALPEVVAYYNK